MKKLHTIVVAAVLLSLVIGLAWAGSSGQGVPSAKCAASWSKIEYTPTPDNIWYEDPGLSAIIKTSEPADLIISVTAECLLVTNVKIKGTGEVEESQSFARIECKVEVLTDEGWKVAEPGDVVFAYRYVRLTGLLWSPGQVGMPELPEQYIEIYEKSKTANGFNFVLKNVGSGVREVKVYWKAETLAGFPEGEASAVVGKRTLVVEAVRMVND